MYTRPRSLEETLDRREEKREREGVHRVSSPWLKLLSAVGVIPILVMKMKRGKSSAQHSRSDNHYRKRESVDSYLRGVHPPPLTLREPSIGGRGERVGCTA